MIKHVMIFALALSFTAAAAPDYAHAKKHHTGGKSKKHGGKSAARAQTSGHATRASRVNAPTSRGEQNADFVAMDQQFNDVKFY